MYLVVVSADRLTCCHTQSKGINTFKNSSVVNLLKYILYIKYY